MKQASPPPARAGSNRIVLIRMDRRNSTTTLVRSDGKEASFQLPSLAMSPTSAISMATWAPEQALVHFETTAGDQIVAELPRLGDPAPLRGRPVVYLDQNHWSTIARTIYAPTRVRAAGEREAARHVIALARERKVVLPMSAGHMAETCKWTNARARYQLALTFLQLSAGWQMRDPLDLRRLELRQALARSRGSGLPQPPTFTLEPCVVHGEARGPQPLPDLVDFSVEEALAVRALTCVSGYFDTMLDAEAVPLAIPPGWVDKLQRFTDWIAEQPRDPHLGRQRTGLMFIDDLAELSDEAHRAGVTPEELGEWLEHSEENIRTLPSLGLFREVLHEKLVNPTTKWRTNDLMDLMYLTCAAGYADHVVGENNLTTLMEQAMRRLGRPTRLHRRLRDLAEAI